MKKLIAATALLIGLPALAFAETADAPKKERCCDKMKAEGKKCCCDDMGKKDETSHDGNHDKH